MEGLFLPVLLVLFVVLMFNSQRKRQRQFNQMQASLEVGKDVVTTAGLHATIVELDGDVAVLEVSAGQTVRWDRRSIGRVLESPHLDEDPDEVDDEDEYVDEQELDEADVGEGSDSDDSGVDLGKSRPPTDEK